MCQKKCRVHCRGGKTVPSMLSSIKQPSLFPSLCLFSTSLPRQQPLPSRSFLSSNSPTPPWSFPTRLVYSSSTPLRAAAEDASTSFSPPLVSSVAPAQPALVVQWNISQKHFKFLNAVVCLVRLLELAFVAVVISCLLLISLYVCLVI